MALDMHAQEVMELSQVLHGELRLHRSDGALKELGRRSCEDYVIDIQQQVDQVITSPEDEQGGA
jgi:hypothetical protein